MPRISEFYGIIVNMYCYDHGIPHIHAQYGGDKAVFAISNGAVIDNELPRAKTRRVQTWIEIHREELMECWEKAVNGKSPFNIEPLR